jgi:hypothetical protein
MLAVTSVTADRIPHAPRAASVVQGDACCLIRRRRSRTFDPFRCSFPRLVECPEKRAFHELLGTIHPRRVDRERTAAPLGHQSETDRLCLVPADTNTKSPFPDLETQPCCAVETERKTKPPPRRDTALRGSICLRTNGFCGSNPDLSSRRSKRQVLQTVNDKCQRQLPAQLRTIFSDA